MSEYQYYEFCSIKQPLSAEARKEMNALSSRANVGTHGASYVYNYSDFRGNSEKLLAKYFDVFFYISNFGTTELMLKYPLQCIDKKMLAKYTKPYVIMAKELNDCLILTLHIEDEAYGGGWIEGEGMLSDLLPIHEEIRQGDDRLLKLIYTWHQTVTGEISSDTLITTDNLSPAQRAFVNCSGIRNVENA